MIARTSFYTKNFFEKVRNQLKFFKSKIKKEKLKHTQNSIKKKNYEFFIYYIIDVILSNEL